jgi:salicylate biosynthesis isochorismate synthase/menaquinone-specific isochorismate synthase
VGWALGNSGLLGWGCARVLEARTAGELVAARESLFGGGQAQGPWLGGWAFDLDHPPAGAWAGFPLLRFVVPEVVLRWRGAGAQVGWVSGAEALAREVERCWAAPQLAERLARASWTPGHRSHWDALHARALAEISAGRLDKVVLARSVEGRCSVSPLQAFLVLARDNPAARAFLFRHGDSTFLGATPETLCRVEGDRLDTEALAGTSPVGDAGALAQSAKDLREHAHVVASIVSALEGKVSELTLPASPEVVLLPRIAHLRTGITARLSDRSVLPGLLGALHPTPAVNGVPRDRASAFLRAEERLERGWFTGVMGCVDGVSIELRVALRCALLRDDGTAEAYAGAGVVAGSTADGEWLETARKLRTAQAGLGEDRVAHV